MARKNPTANRDAAPDHPDDLDDTAGPPYRVRVKSGQIRTGQGENGLVGVGEWITLDESDFRDCRHQVETREEIDAAERAKAEAAEVQREGRVDPWFEAERKRAIENERARREANAAAQLRASELAAAEAFGNPAQSEAEKRKEL